MKKTLNNIETQIFLDNKPFPVLSLKVNHSWAVAKGFGEIKCQVAFYSKDESGNKFLSVERKICYLESIYRTKNKRIINLKSR
jgi:hypothetical protein